MRLLLDEQLDYPAGTVAAALNQFAPRSDCTFERFPAGRAGMADPEIPEHCRQNGFLALVSFNHRDFGRKLELYAELIEQGVSVVVLRPPDEEPFTPERQGALILRHLRRIAQLLAAADRPILVRVSPAECRQRTLDDLRGEFSRGGRRDLP